MVWGMISSIGVGPIVRFHDNVKASVFKELLRQHAFPHLCKGRVETRIFMQDKALCIKAKTMLSFHEGIGVMKLPLQIPDINLLENVWKIMGEKAQNSNPQNIVDL